MELFFILRRPVATSADHLRLVWDVLGALATSLGWAELSLLYTATVG